MKKILCSLLVLAVTAPALANDSAPDDGPWLEVEWTDLDSKSPVEKWFDATRWERSPLDGYVESFGFRDKDRPQRVVAATVWSSHAALVSAALVLDSGAPLTLESRSRLAFRRVRHSVVDADAPVGHVELVIHRTKPGTARRDNLRLFDATEPAFQSSEGLIGHSLWISSEGIWLHEVRWRSAAAFDAGSKALMQSAEVRSWIRSLDFERFVVSRGDARHHRTPAGATPERTRTLSPRDFVRAYRRAMRKHSPDVRVSPRRELEVELRRGDLTHTAYLDNAFQAYQATPKELNAILDQYTRAAVELLSGATDSDAIVPDRVVPVIKDAAYLDEIRKSLGERGRDTDLEMYHEKLNDELIVLYALDTEANIRYLTRSEVKELGFPDLRKRAVENLLALLPDIERHGEAGLFIIVADGNYEASLILEDSLWTKENFEVKGDFVIAIPSRDVLLIAGTGDAEGVEKLRSTAKSVKEEHPYGMTDDLFVRRNGKWVKLASE